MRASVALLAFGSIVAVACSKSPSSPRVVNLCANSGAAVVVTASDNYTFSPADISITVGQSVCWQNTGTLTHNIVENVAGRFGGNLPSGQTIVHTFTFGENYAYHCSIHSNMTGTLVVNCQPGQLSC